MNPPKKLKNVYLFDYKFIQPAATTTYLIIILLVSFFFVNGSFSLFLIGNLHRSNFSTGRRWKSISDGDKTSCDPGTSNSYAVKKKIPREQLQQTNSERNEKVRWFSII